MSLNQRLMLIGLAVIVAVVAFFLLIVDDEESTKSTRSTTPSTALTATTPPPTSTSTSTSPTPPTAPPTSPPQPPAAQQISVENGEPVGGVKKITVKKDDTVQLEVTTTEPEEIHVHGYDLKQNATPDEPARFDFKADIEGVFDVELEQSGTKIASLTVEP